MRRDDRQMGKGPFAASRFQYGVYRDYEGELVEWPYPTLITSDAHYLRVSRWLTAFWGAVQISVALIAIQVPVGFAMVGELEEAVAAAEIEVLAGEVGPGGGPGRAVRVGGMPSTKILAKPVRTCAV